MVTANDDVVMKSVRSASPAKRSASRRAARGASPVEPRQTEPQSVGVRELKSALSEHLRRVSAGESIVVTDRGKPVARLVPPDLPDGIVRMLREGSLRWSGRKPDFTNFSPIKLNGPGKSVSDILIEDRYRD